MNRRLLYCVVAFAFAKGAWAVPAVSGDGACGIRAVDNESFLTCEGDRAPDPVGETGNPSGDQPDRSPVVTLSCRYLEAPARRTGEAPPGEVVLQCRPIEASRLAAARP
jgi:hypothetical protein